jgi:hypothetical protein
MRQDLDQLGRTWPTVPDLPAGGRESHYELLNELGK